MKAESNSWECDLVSSMMKPATLDAYEARVSRFKIEPVDQNEEEEDISMNTEDLESSELTHSDRLNLCF